MDDASMLRLLRQIIERVATEVVAEMFEISILLAIKLSIVFSLRM